MNAREARSFARSRDQAPTPSQASRRQFLREAGALAAAAWAPKPSSAQLATPGNITPRIIDVHHHIYPPDYTRENLHLLTESGGGLPASVYLEWTPARAIEQMDRAGVGTAIASISSPGVWFAQGQAGRMRARECNDHGARMIRDHPGRFGMFAAIPLPDTEGSLREIEYALDVLRLDGIGIFTHYAGKWLGDASFAPVFEELNRRRAVVFVHPVSACCLSSGSSGLARHAEHPMDMTRAMAQLLLSGTLVRFPDIRFIFAHAGGSLLPNVERLNYLIGRMTPEQRDMRAPQGVEHEFLRHFYDVANVAQMPAWAQGLRALIPPSQVLFGSNEPFSSSMLAGDSLTQLGLASGHLEGMQRDNALRLFPRLSA